MPVWDMLTFDPLAKTYKYISGPYRILPSHLTLGQLSSSTYHFLTSPLDTAAQIPELLKLREEVGIVEKPLVIWEPIPLACNSEELENLFECLASGQIGLWSPNHVELGRFWGEKVDEGEFTRERVESLAGRVRVNVETRGSGTGKDMTMVIRCGEEGCCIWSRKEQKWVWIEAFHQNSAKVVDATGAGNAFLGGFAIGWKGSGGDEVVGCVLGSVAAGVVCGGLGVPKLELNGEKREECWNGVIMGEILKGYWERLRGKGVIDGALEERWCLERI